MFEDWYTQNCDFKDFDSSSMKAVYDSLVERFKKKLKEAYEAGKADAQSVRKPVEHRGI